MHHLRLAATRTWDLIGIPVIACLLHAYCRLAEDRQSVRMRDLTEDTPDPALLVGQIEPETEHDDCRFRTSAAAAGIAPP